jgi:hypothetical protein
MHIESVEKMATRMINRGCTVPIHLWGRPGIAKTAVFEQIAKKLNFRFYPLYLSQIEPFELLGAFQTIEVKDKDGNVIDRYLDYIPPKWCYEARKHGRFILFLDEFNRARPDVISAVYSLVNERKLNGIPFKGDVFIFAASNPDNGQHDVQRLEKAIVGRFMNIKVSPDVDVWMNWANRVKDNGSNKKNIHEDVSRFILNNPKALFKDGEAPGIPESVKTEIEENPRAWERASQIHECEFSATMEMECLEGILGATYALAFMRSLADGVKPLTVQEVFTMSDENIDRLKSFSSFENSKLPMIQVTIQALDEYLNDPDEAIKLAHINEAEKNVQNIIKFLKLIPKDKFLQAMEPILSSADCWGSYFHDDPEIFELVNSLSEMVNQATQQATKEASNKRLEKPKPQKTKLITAS